MITEQVLRTWLILLFGFTALGFAGNWWYARRKRNRLVHRGRLFKDDRRSVRLSKRMYPK